MSLRNALQNQLPKQPKCKLQQILDNLSPDDQEAFTEYLELGLHASGIASAITEAAEPISEDTVRHHLNFLKGVSERTCLCARKTP